MKSKGGPGKGISGELRGKGKKDAKSTALARGAFHLNSSPMGLGNGLTDGETQARSAFKPASGRVRPVKPAEDFLPVFLGDADPRVGDLEDGPFFIGTEGCFYASSGGGIFDPVVHQVEEESSEVVRIPLDMSGFDRSSPQFDRV